MAQGHYIPTLPSGSQCFVFSKYVAEWPAIQCYRANFPSVGLGWSYLYYLHQIIAKVFSFAKRPHLCCWLTFSYGPVHYKLLKLNPPMPRITWFPHDCLQALLSFEFDDPDLCVHVVYC